MTWSQWPRGLMRRSAAAAEIVGSNLACGINVSVVSGVCCQVEVSATS